MIVKDGVKYKKVIFDNGDGTQTITWVKIEK